MTVRPIFLLSQPRAGSTFVQRVIAAHPRVATTSEPWLMLPLAYSLRERGARAEYWHAAAAQAIDDFCAELPGGRADYLLELGAAVMRLYERATGRGASYFLDKTPHYHLIVRELLDAFPDAKLVFLWRNPLAVLASLLATFREARWEPWHFRVDIFDAIANLVSGYETAGDRAVCVRYERLLEGESEWRRLFDHLGLEFSGDLLARSSSVRLAGRYGDRGSAKAHPAQDRERSPAWPEALASPIRRRWCRGYLEWIGDERLATMGYERSQLLAELAAGPRGAGRVPADLVHAGTSRLLAARRARALRIHDSPLPTGSSWGRRRRDRLQGAARAAGRRIRRG